MRNPKDKGNYRADNQRTVHGQVVGEGNHVVNNFYPSNQPSPSTDTHLDSSPLFGPAFFLIIVAIVGIAFFFFIVLAQH